MEYLLVLAIVGGVVLFLALRSRNKRRAAQNSTQGGGPSEPGVTHEN